jgi:hypothetical protein
VTVAHRVERIVASIPCGNSKGEKIPFVGVFVPEVSFLVIDRVFFPELPVFYLECGGAMIIVLF